jgi:hypothetical protein
VEMMGKDGSDGGKDGGEVVRMVAMTSKDGSVGMRP